MMNEGRISGIELQDDFKKVLYLTVNYLFSKTACWGLSPCMLARSIHQV